MQFVAQSSAAGDRHGLEKTLPVFAALLRADLKDFAGLLHDAADLLAFINREREGLFAVDVFPRPHGVDGDLHVPMIGCPDCHRVDVTTFQQRAVVAVDFTFTLNRFREFSRALAVHVAAGDQIPQIGRLASDSRASTADADRRHRQPLVRTVRGEDVAGPNVGYRQAQPGS